MGWENQPLNEAPLITTETAEGICRLGMNRPEKKNALSAIMYAQLAEGLKHADQDPAVRVILIHGTPECFTAGNDLKDFRDSPPTEGNSTVFQFLETISTAVKPIAAAVNGPAIGIGTSMLLHCDLVYAGENSTFQLPFVNLGLCPEAGSSYLLPLFLGHQRAAELLLLGKPFSAAKAFELGLVNQVIPDGDALPAALEVCREVAALPPAALRETKQLIKQHTAPVVADAMRHEGQAFLNRLKSPEAQEAFAAFFERRPPDFSAFQ